MWYPLQEPTEASEPVSLDDAKRHLHVRHSDDDEYIAGLIVTARQHVEAYCGTLWAQAVALAHCDDWTDLSRLPVAHVTEIETIAYVDHDGEPATLDGGVYELRADARAVVPAPGESWPARQRGSRIGVTMKVGAENVPAPVRHAILMRVEDLYEHRGSEDDVTWSTFDSLLANFRFY